MSTTKTTTEKIGTLEEKIQQLENQKKILLQKQKSDERRARDHRLCKRGAYMESIFPDTIPLTDEQFYQFLDKTLLTDYAKKIFAEITAQKDKTATEKSQWRVSNNSTAAAEKATVTEQGGD